MTDTYKESDPIELKIKEELRCIRCASERLLRLIAPQEFVDYQMEKFSGQERKIKITVPVLEFFLKQGKNYSEIKEILKRNKSTISEHVKTHGLNKKFNIKAGAKKGVIPKNLQSLHVKGELNPNWKGNAVGYQALHAWVRDRLGKPKRCVHCGVKSKCHIKYDKMEKFGKDYKQGKR